MGLTSGEQISSYLLGPVTTALTLAMREQVTLAERFTDLATCGSKKPSGKARFSQDLDKLSRRPSFRVDFHGDAANAFERFFAASEQVELTSLDISL